jgi:hypothetical protein
MNSENNLIEKIKTTIYNFHYKEYHDYCVLYSIFFPLYLVLKKLGSPETLKDFNEKGNEFRRLNPAPCWILKKLYKDFPIIFGNEDI